MFCDKDSMLVSRSKLEMLFWKEWSGVYRPDQSVECFDEDVLTSNDQQSSSNDQVDRCQFLTWEDLVGQR